MMVPKIDTSSLSSRRPAKHYSDRTGADIDQKSDKGIPTPTGRRGLLEEMDQGVPVGTSLLPPCSTTLWKKCAISRWRRRPLTGGNATSPYVEKGGESRICDEAEMGKREVILRTQDEECLARPVLLVIPLDVDQGGEDVEDDKL